MVLAWWRHCTTILVRVGTPDRAYLRLGQQCVAHSHGTGGAAAGMPGSGQRTGIKPQSRTQTARTLLYG